MKFALDYAGTQERKRWILSFVLTAAFYLLIFVIAFVIQLMSPPEELVLSNKTVVVNLAGPEKLKTGLGSIYPSDVGEEGSTVEAPAAPPALPKASVPTKTAPQKTPEKAKTEVAQAKPAQTAPQPQAQPETRTSPLEMVSQVDTKPPAADQEASQTAAKSTQTVSAAEEQQPAAQAQPPAEPESPWAPSGPRTSKSGQTGANQFLYVPGQGMVPWGEGNSYIVRKAEKGNGMETAFGGSKGTVGHNIYVPVADSMPLPSTVPVSVYEKGALRQSAEAATQRKRDFLSYYELKGDSYVMKKQVPLENRGLIWPILDDGKYDMTKAEYKQGKNLSPIIIGFTITKDNQLKDVQILQSSGDPEIDRSVEYGFKRASFWNKTGETVPGKFTYYF
ncbi:MAG: energy transducer TonB [Spirochaetaceae bacterium]|nr:energy transducer TonB [Spirochaetaceae bacterium]